MTQILTPPTVETKHRMAITFCVMAASTMQMLDQTIANVALPYMQGSMSAGRDQINWILTSYIVAAAIVTPTTGWLTVRLGRTRLYLLSVAGFTVASVLCGLASSLPQIVVFRMLQGVFGATLSPLSQSVMFDIFPREQRGKAMSIWGVGVMVAPILGPIIGGYITDTLGWRWVFFINVPVGIIAWFGLVTFLPETEKIPGRKLDWFGFALLSLAIAAFQLGLDRGGQLDWLGSNEIIAEFTVAALALYSFVIHIMTAKNPFISRALFKDRNFVAGCCVMFAVAVVMMSGMATLSPFLQQVVGYPVVTTGLYLTPRGIGTMAAMWVGGQLLDKGISRPLIAIGLVLVAHSQYVLTEYSLDIPTMGFLLNGVEQGIGTGMIFSALSAIAFTTLPAALRYEGTAFFSLARSTGGAIGISIIVSLVDKFSQVNHASIAAQITPFNRMLQGGTVGSMFDPMVSRSAGALDAMIEQQASVIAYLNVFQLMAYIALASIPLMLIVKPPSLGAAPESVHSE